MPSLADRVVKVSAYLTDETFGYDHWRAAQFSTPGRDRYGALVLFETEEERDAFLTREFSGSAPTPETPSVGSPPSGAPTK
jgi:hypothetical protein